MFSLKSNPQKKTLLIMLTVASLVMIGVQLVSYQYDGIPLPSGMVHWSSDDDAQAVDSNAEQEPLHPYDFSHNTTHDHSDDEKYLTYLPYSRFSNQRSTLLNAALLAKYLNRTLIVPPMFLGSANGWSPAPGLYQVLANMTDVAFQERCFDENENALIEDIVLADDGEQVLFGCYNFTTYTMVPWSWATDLHRLSRSEADGGLGIKILERSDMALTKLQRDLGLPDDEMYLMQDSTRYQWHIYDKDQTDRNLRYQFEISLKELDDIQHRLLHFYGIFGYDRLMLQDEWSDEYRLRIEQALMFRHSAIGEASSIILDQLLNGIDKDTSDLVPLDPVQAQEKQDQEKELPRFVAAHVRAGDGVFLKKLKDRVPEFVHQIWDIMSGNETSTDDLIGASNRINATDVMWPPQRQLYPLPKARYALRKELGMLGLSDRLSECARRKMMVLYVATDAPDPRTNRELKPILDAFPCTFFMSDFPSNWREPLERVRSPLDPHKDLTQHLIMFVDATVCAWAERFVGTRTSTFSNYIKQYRHAIVDEIIEHQGFA